MVAISRLQKIIINNITHRNRCKLIIHKSKQILTYKSKHQNIIKKMTKSIFIKLIKNIIMLNPHITNKNINDLINKSTLNNDGYIQNLCLNSLSLKELPENCWLYEINGNVNLSNNKLKLLPCGFEKLKIGGSLNCSCNGMLSLNSNFGNITIGDSIDLSNNLFSNLPETFTNLKVRGDLNLSQNKLKNSALLLIPQFIIKSLYFNNNNEITVIPANFYNMIIGGNLEVFGCPIIELPFNFIKIYIGKKLLHNNQYIQKYINLYNN